MNGTEKFMLDSNILIYAFDASEGLKHELASELFEEVLVGNLKVAISPQILSEFFVNITGEKKKTGVNIPVSVEEARSIIGELTAAIPSISILDLKGSTVVEALYLKQLSRASYWDCLIAATMKEHGITTIYTEDKEFEKIEGLKVVNPFEKKKQ